MSVCGRSQDIIPSGEQPLRYKNEKHKQLKKVGMLLQKRINTRGVGIGSMRKSIYLLTTTPIDSTIDARIKYRACVI